MNVDSRASLHIGALYQKAHVSIKELQNAFSSTLSELFITMQSRVLISIDVVAAKTIKVVQKSYLFVLKELLVNCKKRNDLRLHINVSKRKHTWTMLTGNQYVECYIDMVTRTYNQGKRVCYLWKIRKPE